MLINDSTTVWQLVTSGAWQASILRPILLNTIISCLDAENVIPQQISEWFKGRGRWQINSRSPFQWHFAEIKDWIIRESWKFSKKKCKDASDQNRPAYELEWVRNKLLKRTWSNSGWQTPTSQEHIFVVKKANHALGCTRENTVIRSRRIMTPFCLVLVRRWLLSMF